MPSCPPVLVLLPVLLLLPLLAGGEVIYQRMTLVENQDGVLVYEEAEPLPNDQCWQYTWVGTYDSAVNPDTTTCSDYMPMDICNEPIVFTTGNTNQPDVGALASVCKGEGGVDETDSFNCTCKRGPGQSCVKYTRFLTDSADVAVYSSSFCGLGIENSNFDPQGSPVTSGCSGRAEGEVGFEIEACFCMDARCNSSTRPAILSLAILASLASLITLVTMVASRNL